MNERLEPGPPSRFVRVGLRPMVVTVFVAVGQLFHQAPDDHPVPSRGIRVSLRLGCSQAGLRVTLPKPSTRMAAKSPRRGPAPVTSTAAAVARWCAMASGAHRVAGVGL